MESVIRDIRTGVRSLLKNRSFALTACLTLAIGLGANTAIFSFVNALLLRPLPFPNADRLLVLSEVNPEKRKDLGVASPRNVEDWEKQSQTIEQFSVWRDWHFRAASSTGAPIKVGSGIC